MLISFVAVSVSDELEVFVAVTVTTTVPDVGPAVSTALAAPSEITAVAVLPLFAVTVHL